uniref:Uncharacterized protein n=1 Tax=Ostreococcus mediterraneus TaxID=1486918 RepID=A0A7S0KMI9_9CHLO
MSDDVASVSAFEASMMSAKTEFDASVCATSPSVRRGVPVEVMSTALVVGCDDDDDDDDDAHTSIAERRQTNALALALTLERDAAESRARALEAFAREEMRACDARCAALSADVEDLLAALGAATSADARRRWRFAIRAVCERVKRAKEEEKVALGVASRRRLERQLLRVQRYVSVAADDFERLNARLAKEARDARDAREGERLAKDALAAALASASDADATATVATHPRAADADARRADAKAKCASVRETMAHMLAEWRARDPTIAERLQRAARA